MLFKELKKFLKCDYNITLDGKIILEIARKCGWDDTDDFIYDAFPEPEDYLREYDIDIKELEPNPINLSVWKRIEEVSNNNWNIDTSLEKYVIDYIDDGGYGRLTIHLKYNE